MRFLAYFLTPASILAAILVTLGADPSKAEPFLYPTRPLTIAENRPFPPITPLTTEGGVPLSLDDFKGKVVLLNFWATWCGPCVIEMPDLDKLQRKYGLGGLEVVAISLNEGKDHQKIKQFYAEHGLTHLKPYTPRGAPVAEAYGIRTLPSSILIGRDGRIVGHVAGFTNWQDPSVEKYIQEELRRRF